MTGPLSTRELRSTKPARRAFAELDRLPVSLVLDDLKCAHNVGSILRLADALRLACVRLCGRTIRPPHGKIRKTSRGAEKWVPWTHHEEVTEAITRERQAGARIIAVEMAAGSLAYDGVTCTDQPVCFILGREFDGVSPHALAASDLAVHLPIFGMANSLNVAATASVVAYEAVRQLSRAGRLPADVAQGVQSSS